MAGISKNLSNSSNTSENSSNFVANEPPVRTPGSKGRCGRPSKKRENEKTILSWLIDCKKVQENAVVCYLDNNAKIPLKEGRITRVGILCLCCIQVLTAEHFQAHAGWEIGKPFENIFIMETQSSLLSCMNEACNQPRELARHKFNIIEGEGGSSDIYDDACMICADGGELMCCDKCNSTYHHRCMDMEEIPENSWLCPYCVCKLCGDPARENDYLLMCSQCEKNYHWECYREREPILIDVNSPPCSPFCEQSCREVYEKLEMMVGVNNKLDDGYTWTLLKRMDEEYSDDGVHNLIDFYKRTECHSKLAIAWSVMKDCFEPITDRHTKIDVIQSIVYNSGSNYTRINFRGFYTAVLEKDGEIISAASLRIHGTKLAEMPFIATREMHRGKGMCRKLRCAIESALSFLKVEYLIIPSVRQKEKNWNRGYNFCRLKAMVKKEIMSHNTLMFHDSVRLQKTLLPPDISRAMVAREVGNNVAEFDLNLEP